MLEGRLCERDEELATLYKPWEALGTEGPVSPVFVSPRWFRTWRTHFGHTTRNGVLALHEGERLVGVMPFMNSRVRRGPALSVRFDYRTGDEVFLSDSPRYRVLPVRQFSYALGLESGNLRDGLRCLPGHQAACAEAVLRCMARAPGWQVAVLPIPESQFDGWRDALAASGLRGYFRQGLSWFYSRRRQLAWPELLRTRNHKARSNFNHAHREAERRGLRMELHEGSRACGTGLAALLGLARQSWKERGRADQSVHLPMTTDTEAFLRAMCLTEAPGWQPLIWLLTEGAVPRAGLLGIVHAGVLFTWLAYYDPAVADAYPGRLLLKAALEWAHEREAAWVDFNATHDWVRVFADEVCHYHQLVVFQRGVYPGLLHRMSQPLCDTFDALPPPLRTVR